MAEINQNEYIDTSEFLEPEDSMEISSDFTDITPYQKDGDYQGAQRVRVLPRPPLWAVVDAQVRVEESGRQIASV